MSVELKAIVLRWINDGLNGRNLAVIDELFAPNYVNHSPRLGDVGREYTAKETAGFFKALSDWQTAAEGAVVPSTGKLVTFTIWETSRVSSGKIVERWAIHDFQQQISET